jgi:hypothetical protein
MNLSLKKNGLYCPNPNTHRRVYVRVNERTFLVNASTAAASRQGVETASEYKDKEAKRDLERSLRHGGNDKSGMDKSQIRAETPHGTVHGFHHRM